METVEQSKQRIVIDADRLALLRARLDANTHRSEGCWLWTGYTQPNGYGWINYSGLKMAAHRAALLVSGSDVPADMDVCHRCDVRNCVNPAHLYVGSRAENMADCTARQRHNKPHGEKHWCAKLSAGAVAEIRVRRSAGDLISVIARDFDVHHSTVLRIARGDYRKEVA